MDYARHYAKLISRARSRPIWASRKYDTHHIVPRCMGGGEERENLVSLTVEEHYIAHQLLAKMHPDHPLVVYTAEFMSRAGSRLRMPGNKRYARARRAALVRRERQKGHYVWRRRKVKPKRYGAADVERLKKMLRSRADSA